MKTFDFTNPAQWKYEAFCVFARIRDDDDESYYIAKMLAETIAEENGRNDTYRDARQVPWFDYTQAMSFADPESRFRERATCDHCGAHFAYGAAYRNIVTGEHAIVGHICATNTLNLTASEYAMKRAQTRMKSIRERARADAREARLNVHRRRLLHYADGYHPTDRSDPRNPYTVDLCRDMRAKFRKYESLSVKQWAYLRSMIDKDRERAERRAADQANARPIPDELLTGRHTLTGRIVSTKYHETMYGETLKMLFVDDRGFKLYGTVPSSLPYDIGDRVQFDAAIDRSDDDATFGFFNRPTKARNLEKQEAA